MAEEVFLFWQTKVRFCRFLFLFQSPAFESYNLVQSTPDNSNPQGKSKKVRVIGSSSYRKLRTNDQKKGKNGVYCFSVHTMYSLNKLF